jgi:hypothetical protein
VLTSLIATGAQGIYWAITACLPRQSASSRSARAGLSVVIGYLVDAGVADWKGRPRQFLHNLRLIPARAAAQLPLGLFSGDCFPYRECLASAESTGSIPLLALFGPRRRCISRVPATRDSVRPGGFELAMQGLDLRPAISVAALPRGRVDRR